MRKTLNIVILIAALLVPSLASADASKMDLMLHHIHQKPTDQRAMLGKAVSFEGEQTLVSCFVKSNDVAATEAAIIDAGGEVGTVLTSILTARIPISALETISDREEVVALEADRPLTPKMNVARQFTHVDEVQAGTGLPQDYKGSGSFIGVVDSDFAWKHDDFNNRIQWIQMLNLQGSGPTCDKQEVDSDVNGNQCPIPWIVDPMSFSHGTHVTGIAAGGDSVYTGVAPDAWIGFAFNPALDADSGGTLSTAVVDSVDDLFGVADQGDWPAVINLSLGTSIGAHDDTSLLEQGLNELPPYWGNQGRVIVNAAGNENVIDDMMDLFVNQGGAPLSPITGGIHAEINATSDIAWRFGVWTDEALGLAGSIIVDMWLNQGNDTNCQLQVLAYPYDSSDFANIDDDLIAGLDTDQASIATGMISFGQTGVIATDSGDLVQVEVDTTTAETENNKPRAIIYVSPGSSGAAGDVLDFAYDVIIRPTSGTCTGDMWLYPDQIRYNDFLKGVDTFAVATGAAPGAPLGYDMENGDSFKTTTIPGTASGLITAGSFMGRGTWTDVNGVTHHQDQFDINLSAFGGTAGQVSVFSSLGPTADDRVKPDVVAPGEPIISTLGSGYNPGNALKGDSTHHKLEGTSMSAPHVAGIVALLFQKNNCLTTTEVKQVLKDTADVATLQSETVDPKNTYGDGIVNALDAIKAISENTTCYGGGGGGNGGGCFGSLVPVPPAAAAPALALLFSPLAVIIALRRRNRIR